MTPIPTKWLTPREAADHARLDVATLRRAVRRGALNAYRVNGGHRVRFREADIDAWLGSHQTGGAA